MYCFKVPSFSDEMIGTKNFVKIRKSVTYKYSVSVRRDAR
jgi:hypothetical protein